MTQSTAAAMAAVYGPLVARAGLRLRRLGLPDQDAADLVQEAALRWLAASRAHTVRLRSEHELEAYLGRTVDRLALDKARRRPDVLDNSPLSLDAPWAQG